MFFVLRNPSVQSTWLLQRSVTVCCHFCCFCVTPFLFHTSSVLCCCSSSDFLTVYTWFFSTRLLSASQLQFPLQSRLGVLLLSRQLSILVLLPCVDDFQYLTSFFKTFFSSFVSACNWHCSSCPFDSPLLLGMLFSPAFGCALLACCWLYTTHLLLAVLFCLLLAMLCCHFVPLSEILVDLPLVVVQVLRLCAPFWQSGVASFVDFSSSLALLAVMLSQFSVFWRRFLQLHLVVVYCSVRLVRQHCATS